jgi:hypothetical protein
MHFLKFYILVVTILFISLCEKGPRDKIVGFWKESTGNKIIYNSIIKILNVFERGP